MSSRNWTVAQCEERLEELDREYARGFGWTAAEREEHAQLERRIEGASRWRGRPCWGSGEHFNPVRTGPIDCR